MVKKDDEQHLVNLMTRYQQGESEAFTGLYEALKAPLQRYLWTFVRNSTTAEDLVQDAFMQIHRARHTYASPRPVRPWVYAISRHVALMHLRSKRRRKESLATEDLPEVPVPPAMDHIADSSTLFTLMANLPKSGQEVLTLHHLLGLSFKEIGDVLGVAPGTAKVRAHRALNALKDLATEKGGPNVGATRS